MARTSPCLHHARDGAHGLLDGHTGIEARGAVHVDVVRAEWRERVGEEVLHRRGARVEAAPGAVGATQRAELHAELRLMTPPFERAPDQQRVLAHAVELAGVEQRDAAFERRVHGRDALRVARAVHPALPAVPMQPRAMGKTAGPVLPSCRVGVGDA